METINDKFKKKFLKEIFSEVYQTEMFELTITSIRSKTSLTYCSLKYNLWRKEMEEIFPGVGERKEIFVKSKVFYKLSDLKKEEIGIKNFSRRVKEILSREGFKFYETF